MDLRPVIAASGMIPGAHAHLRQVAAVAALGVSGDADAGQVRGAIGRRRHRSSQAASEMGVIWQMVRSWGPLQWTGNDMLPTILHASAELPSGQEWLKTGSSK